MPEKLDRCVDKVKGKKGVDSAYAICNANIGEMETDPQFDLVHESLMKEHHSPMDLLNYPTKDPDPPTKEGGKGSGRTPKGSYGGKVRKMVTDGVTSHWEDMGHMNEGGPGSGPQGGQATVGKSFGGAKPTTVKKRGSIEPIPTIAKKAGSNVKGFVGFTEEESFPYPFPVVPSKDSGRDQMLKHNEAVAIGGGLSAQSVGGKKKNIKELELCNCANFDSVYKALVKETSEGGKGSGIKGHTTPKDDDDDADIPTEDNYQNEPPPDEQTPADKGLGGNGIDPEADARYQADYSKATEYLGWLDDNDMLTDAGGAMDYLTKQLSVLPQVAKDALRAFGADESYL